MKLSHMIVIPGATSDKAHRCVAVATCRLIPKHKVSVLRIRQRQLRGVASSHMSHLAPGD